MASQSHRLAVIVFTDIVGYSRMVQADERLALELLAEHNRIVAGCIEAGGGRTLKTIGDAFMAAFDSAGAAVQAAAEIQRCLAERNRAQPPGRQVQVRIGVHAGDVVFTADDALGDGVNVASRVEAEAGPGQVYVSHDVFSITYDRVPFGYKEIGLRELKNISRPIHIYELLWDPARQGEANARPPRSAPAPAPRRGRVAASVVGIAVLAAAAVVVFQGPRTAREGSPSPAEKPALAVVGFADDTGDERLGRLQIGRILDDAVVHKFYEFRPVRLVSPVRVAQAKRDLGVSEAALHDPGLVALVGRQAGGRLVVSGRLGRLGESFVLSADLNDLDRERVLDQRVLTERSEERLLGLVDSVSALFQHKLAGELHLQAPEDSAVPVGDLTTRDLEAYGHFVKGYNLYMAGQLLAGAEELAAATRIDTGFAMAYAEAACAYSFAKEDSLAEVYFRGAERHADRELLAGVSKEALIFQGSLAWGRGEHERSCERYQLATELYPDDRDTHLYRGLCQQYLYGERQGVSAEERERALTSAIDSYRIAADLSPDYFPIYRDWSLSLQGLGRTDDAVALLTRYVRDHGQAPGVPDARRAIVALRGAAAE